MLTNLLRDKSNHSENCSAENINSRLFCEQADLQTNRLFEDLMKDKSGKVKILVIEIVITKGYDYGFYYDHQNIHRAVTIINTFYFYLGFSIQYNICSCIQLEAID
ncbi:Hypothetical predicted protein [Octopus vulgaris]|uniref:Uncharacterized protein n=1 Tax=Octopus vulgaris TaxID=6645 RepID=A0AA36AGF7_OCTVU|nr:Hypothetical predicted protein [Octopus vulgaris]